MSRLFLISNMLTTLFGQIDEDALFGQTYTDVFWVTAFPGLVSPFVHFNASAYNDILDNSILSTLRWEFREGPFLFQCDSAPCTKPGPERNGLPNLK